MAMSSTQQIVMRKLKTMQQDAFYRVSIRSRSDINAELKRTGTILNDCINEYFIIFLCSFYGFSSGT
jgi:hypothetical protein